MQTQASVSSTEEYCSTHDGSQAAWRCVECGKNLCPLCAALQEDSRAKIIRCVHCRGLAYVLTEKQQRLTWWQSIPMLAKSLLTTRALSQFLIIGIALSLFKFMPIVGIILNLGLLATFLFFVLNTTALGENELSPLSSMQSEVYDLLIAAVRLILATAILWFPFMAYYAGILSSRDPNASWISLWSDPLVLLLLVLALAYVPAAFVVAALSSSIISVINPLKIVAFILREPKQYAALAAFCALLFFANNLLANALTNLAGPVCLSNLTGMIAITFSIQTVTLVLPTLSAMVLGRFLYQHAQAFDFVVPSRPNKPSMPYAVPRGTLPASDTQSQPSASQAQPEALELESTPAQVLAGALRSGHAEMALNAYRQLIQAQQKPNLSAQAEVALAGLLQRQADYKGAVNAYRRAAQLDLADPLAPRALTMAAQILATQLHMPTEARTLCQYLIKNYPHQPLTEHVKQLLAQLPT